MSSITNQTIEGFVSIDISTPCHPILSNATIQLHNGIKKKINDLQVCNNSDERFGILEISVSKTKVSNHPTYIEFDIDTSGSMEDIASGIHTKLEFVKKTLDNMYQFIAEHVEAVIYIKVNTFDNQCRTIIPITKITLKNRVEIIAKINDIQSGGCTNIEKAFLQSGKSISEYKEQFPTHKLVYILLTDGNPTAGNIDTDYLKTIKPDACNKCIGYGSDHNAGLLGSCGHYYFINDFENTGKVYGEILHKLLYPALENVEIVVKNGSIYDSVKNSWETSIDGIELHSEQNRTFHIRGNSNTEAILVGTIVGRIDRELEEGEIEEIGNREELYTADVLPDLLDEEDTVCVVDLRKYMYRQKTQELLFESVEYTRQQKTSSSYKNKLKTFFKNMRLYMRENNLMEDPFMKLLCDDIYVCFKTFGKENAEMYVVSRHIGQCNQTPCRANSQKLEDSDEDEDRQIQKQKRKNKWHRLEKMEIEDIVSPSKEEDPDDLDFYKTEVQDDDLYVNESMKHTFRCVSGF